MVILYITCKGRAYAHYVYQVRVDSGRSPPFVSQGKFHTEEVNHHVAPQIHQCHCNVSHFYLQIVSVNTSLVVGDPGKCVVERLLKARGED